MTETPTIESQNLPQPGEGFAGQVQRLNALTVFVRALPTWCREEGATVSIQLVGRPDGVEINLGLPPSADVGMAERVFARLLDTERLMQLETLVDELRNVGVTAEVLSPMIEEAERLALRLHAKDPDVELVPPPPNDPA